METILTQYYQSPYGELLLGSFGDKLCLCDWMLNEKRRVPVDKRIRQALHADYEEGTSEVIARQSFSWMSILPVSGPYSMFHCLQSEQNSSGRCGRSCRTSLTEKQCPTASFHESWAIRKPYVRWRLPMGQMPSPYSSPAIVWWAATIR